MPDKVIEGLVVHFPGYKNNDQKVLADKAGICIIEIEQCCSTNPYRHNGIKGS